MNLDGQQVVPGGSSPGLSTAAFVKETPRLSKSPHLSRGSEWAELRDRGNAMSNQIAVIGFAISGASFPGSEDECVSGRDGSLDRHSMTPRLI